MVGMNSEDKVAADHDGVVTDSDRLSRCMGGDL
jgi:hypothetical protein